MFSLKNFLPDFPGITYFAGVRNNPSSTITELMPPELSDQALIQLQQTHSAEVVEITEAISQTVPLVDACFTTLPKVTLSLKSADCVPILFYHPLPLIGVIHAGRKGTQAGIVKNTLQKIQEKYHLTENFAFWLGPAICKKCYQVNRETDEHYDLIGENTQQIRELLPDDSNKIILSDLCTCHQPENFYSYRRQGKGVPMNFSFISLN